MKSVNVRVVFRGHMSRTAFRPGTTSASLEDQKDFAILGTTRRYDTWAAAATAALKLADRRGYVVTNRALVEKRLTSENP